VRGRGGDAEVVWAKLWDLALEHFFLYDTCIHHCISKLVRSRCPSMSVRGVNTVLGTDQ
jgi:hypothetical protein